jgi:pimeloyl-ACP methyl ester carboxylesterase
MAATQLTGKRRGRYPHKGCRLGFEVRGCGPAAVFIQGLGIHGKAWAPQIDGLAAKYECLSFDNRGVGLSQPLGCRLTLEQMAEDTLVLMDAQGWQSAHLVGQSMGGLIAIEIALKARHRVRSLTLLCSFPRGRDVFPLTSGMIWSWLRTQVGPRRQRRKAMLELVMPESALVAADPELLAAELAPLFGFDLAVQPSVCRRQLWALVRHDTTARLGQLDGLPTLIVNATHDRIAPPSIGRAMAAGIRGARFIEIAGASHAAAIQHAARINALLMEHFALS